MDLRFLDFNILDLRFGNINILDLSLDLRFSNFDVLDLLLGGFYVLDLRRLLENSFTRRITILSELGRGSGEILVDNEIWLSWRGN